MTELCFDNSIEMTLSTVNNFFRQNQEFDGYSCYKTYPICHLRRSRKNPKKLYLHKLDGSGEYLVTYALYLQSVPSTINELFYIGQSVNDNWLTIELRIIKNNYMNPKIGMCELELRLQPRADDVDLLSDVLYIPKF